MRETYRRGEFEARNRQLPADLNQTVVFNANERARQEFERTPVGTPVKCYDVRSTYDVRPIGAFDFNIVSFAVSSGATDSGDATVTMTVPDGFVAVLRNFDVWFDGLQPVALNKNDITWSLQVNGGDVPYNANVPMGVAVDRETVFILVNENNTIGIKLKSTAFENVTLTPNVRFYGEFLPKTERALPFEIANPTNAPNCGAPPARTPNAPNVPSAAPAPTSRAAPLPAQAPLMRTPAPFTRPAPQAPSGGRGPVQRARVRK